MIASNGPGMFTLCLSLYPLLILNKESFKMTRSGLYFYKNSFFANIFTFSLDLFVTSCHLCLILQKTDRYHFMYIIYTTLGFLAGKLYPL